jgi:GT2 family glycosyltransferase
VVANRKPFWKQVWTKDTLKYNTVDGINYVAQAYDENSLVMGPRRNIRSARAEGIKIAREKKASHIFFLDDDILTPPDILFRLLEVNQDIVGGLMHKDDGMPIVFRIEAFGTNNDHYTDHPKDVPFRCGGVGAGCMLIRMSVFDKMDRSWPGSLWYFNYDETGMSMDYRFCQRAMFAGCEVWCLPDPPCQQLSHY